jgi:hypothetical protein
MPAIAASLHSDRQCLVFCTATSSQGRYKIRFDTHLVAGSEAEVNQAASVMVGLQQGGKQRNTSVDSLPAALVSPRLRKIWIVWQHPMFRLQQQ